MAIPKSKQYDPKTKTGWIYENGIAVYYKKGKNDFL